MLEIHSTEKDHCKLNCSLVLKAIFKKLVEEITLGNIIWMFVINVEYFKGNV